MIQRAPESRSPFFVWRHVDRGDASRLRASRFVPFAHLRGFAFQILLGLTLVLSGCTLPGSAAPVVKLGVIAPFEGQERALGYALLPVIKEVVAEANASGELGSYRVLVVAFNDDFDVETARRQAEALALDPSVFGVIGPLTLDAARGVGLTLAQAHIRHIPLPEAKHFSDLNAEAKKATRHLLDGLVADIRGYGRPIGTQPARP